MENKTAVEWLIGRFHYEGFIGNFCSEELIKSKREIMIEIIDQAKAMEQKQIIEAFNYGNGASNLAYGSEYFENKFKK
jgi:hypothetical protein